MDRTKGLAGLKSLFCMSQRATSVKAGSYMQNKVKYVLELVYKANPINYASGEWML